MRTRRYRTGLWLRFYLFATAWASLVAWLGLWRRLRKGKEDPARWHEKRGIASAPRPEGTLIWMHAVGVGEVLALPSLIQAMRTRLPDAQFLVTSSARTSADAFARNLPDQTIHQYLPLDCSRYVARFLDHWQPDLSIWAERDVWPRFTVTLANRNIPLVIVNGRMDAKSFESKRRLQSLFSDVYGRFDHVDVQDDASAKHFSQLGITTDRITVSGSLKSAGPALSDLPEERKIWQFSLSGRRIWLAASTHAGEERAILKALKSVAAKDKDTALILVPRDPHRADQVCDDCSEMGLTYSRIANALPDRSSAQVFVANEIGQMGLWYRLASVAFVGGSLCGVGGHNPYEAARVGTYVLHGPNVQNFQADYDMFHAHRAATLVMDSAELARAVLDADPARYADRLAAVSQIGQDMLDDLADRLVARVNTGGS